MAIRKLSLCALPLLFSSELTQALAQTRTTLHTAQTVIELKAGAHNPILTSIGTNQLTAWKNLESETLINSVVINNQSVPVHWTLNPTQSETDSRRAIFVYESASPKLRLSWIWLAPAAHGPIEHTIRIENLDSRELWVPLQDSFRYKMPFQSGTALQHLYVEKGAGKPSSEGTHVTPVPVGYQWEGRSSTYARDIERTSREIIPFFSIMSGTRESNGWYVGVEFSGRTRLSLSRTKAELTGEIGLNGNPGPFRSRLSPHQVFETPTVFLGAFGGDIDTLGNQLRPWIREVLGNPKTWQNPNYPLLVNNSWGSGMQVDEALSLKMIRDSAELGLEMFHLDAGWFRGVGNWFPDPKKFPHGLAAVADNAHQHGLKFGIWVDWTQAALGTEPGALNLRDPKVHDWTVSDLPSNWKPAEFKGQTIDIGYPPAQHYAQQEVLRLFENYHLDMLEHDGYLVAQGCIRTDHPHAAPDPKRTSVTKQDGSYFVCSSNSTDVSYHAVRAYYDIYKNLRHQHPQALLEVCNDGGRMVDFGSAAHADYFSITDTYDPLSNRRAFYDASHLLPTAMLESYVEKWPTPRLENFRYMLRSGMQGWLTIMLDTNAWTTEQHAAAKQEIELYKTKLRQLIRDADLYHVAPRPDGVHWDGTEYFNRKNGKGVVFAFRGSTQEQSRYSFQLKGLEPDKNYSLHFQDGSSPDQTKTGRSLQTAGLSLSLPIPNSSELIFLNEVI